eukprot:1131564-Rhodomonas_salina.1
MKEERGTREAGGRVCQSEWEELWAGGGRVGERWGHMGRREERGREERGCAAERGGGCDGGMWVGRGRTPRLHGQGLDCVGGQGRSRRVQRKTGGRRWRKEQRRTGDREGGREGGWREEQAPSGGERSRHQIAPTAVHAPLHGACEALWGLRGYVGSMGAQRRLGRVCRPTGGVGGLCWQQVSMVLLSPEVDFPRQQHLSAFEARL